MIPNIDAATGGKTKRPLSNGTCEIHFHWLSDKLINKAAMKDIARR